MLSQLCMLLQSVSTQLKWFKKCHIYSHIELANDWYLVVTIMIGTLSYGAVPAISSILTGSSFNLLQNLANGEYQSLNDIMHVLTLKTMAILITGIGSIPMCWLSISTWMLLGERQGFRMRRELLRTYLVKPLEWYDSNEQLSGQFTQLNRCIEELRASSAESSAIIFQNLATVIALLITAFYYSWSLTLVIIANSPLVIGFAVYFSRLIEKYAGRENNETAVAADIFAWTMNGARTIRLFCTEEHELRRFGKSIMGCKDNYIKTALFSSANYAVLRFLTLCMFVQGFWFGNTMIKKQKLAIGDVVTCFSACILLASTLNNTLHQIVTLQKGAVAVNTFSKFVGSPSTIDEIEMEVKEGNTFLNLLEMSKDELVNGDIVFKDVSFAYPARNSQRVLKKVNLVFPSKKTTFVVGKSGSGKSTLANLLLKLYNLHSGGITIGEHNIDRISTKWLRDNITVVEQSCGLFNDTIRNNITLGTCMNESREGIEQACDMALLCPLLDNLVNGLDTIVGRSGEGLSGGEQQRVLLARAILRDTPILILDEALNAQDIVNRSSLIEAIKVWREGKTTIILTHELSEISSSDFLYLLEAGKVEECGYKKTLLQDCSSKFYQLHELQRKSDYEKTTLDLHDILPLENDKKDDIICHEIEEIVSDTETPVNDKPSSSFMPECYLNPKNVMRSSVDILREQLMHPSRERPSSSTWNSSYNHWTYLENENDLEGNRNDLKPMKIHKVMSNMYSTLTTKGVLLMGLLFSVLSGVANPLFSFTFANLLKGMVPHEDGIGSSYYLRKWSLIVLSVAFCDSLFTFLKCFSLSYCAEYWILNLRIKAMEKILGNSIEWFRLNKNDTARISSLVLNDLRDLRSLASEFLSAVTTLIVISLCGLSWSLASGWKLSLVCISFFPAFVLFTGLYGSSLQDLETKYKTIVAELENHSYQIIKNMRTVKSLQLQAHFTKTYKKFEEEMSNISRKRAIATGLGVAIANALILVTQSVIIYYGMKLVIIGEYNSAKMLQTFTLLLFTIMSCVSLAAQIPEISRGQRAAAHIFDILLKRGDDNYISHKRRYLPFNISKKTPLVSINDRRFPHAHDSTERLANSLNIDVYRNEIVGIVGESGSGKTTLCNKLLALHAVPEGLVYIDDTDINAWDCTRLRSQMAVVDQKPQFFFGSIRDNLTYGVHRSVGDTELFYNLKKVGLDELIYSFPCKLDTVFDNDLMSDGQIQRFAIARALLRKPQILILDECTSSLDPLHAYSITEIVKNNLRNTTVILVTHHEQLMRVCDHLIVLRNGAVAEQGSFDQLFEKKRELHRIVTKVSEIC